MSDPDSGTPGKNSEKKEGNFAGMPVTIWVALIGLASTTISGIIGHNVGVHQATSQTAVPMPVTGGTPESRRPDDTTPKPDVPATDIGVAMNLVRGEIDQPRERVVGHTIACSGTVKRLKPGMHLWLAVEVNGFVWFKDREIEPDLIHGTWSKTIEEYGQGNDISIYLYVADDEAHEEIMDWMKRGEANNRVFEKIARVRGTIRLDHRDGLRVQN
jgi:hypothetical protein